MVLFALLSEENHIFQYHHFIGKVFNTFVNPKPALLTTGTFNSSKREGKYHEIGADIV
jgi:hypothetical protein